MSGAGGFLSGFAGGYLDGHEMKRQKKRDEMLDKMLERTGTPGGEYQRTGSSDGYYAPETWRHPDYQPQGGGGGSRLVTPDPVAEDMTGVQRAFLNATALGESGGAYNIRYTPRGGETFEMTGEHPRVFEAGPHGPSSAAGRYQFTATTWDDMGGGAFTPENQDRRAWELAERDFRARTGEDLTQTLTREGMSERVTRALAPTWAAFRNTPDRWANEFESSRVRYRDAARATGQAPLREPLAGASGGAAAPARFPLAAAQPVQNNDAILSMIFDKTAGVS